MGVARGVEAGVSVGVFEAVIVGVAFEVGVSSGVAVFVDVTVGVGVGKNKFATHVESPKGAITFKVIVHDAPAGFVIKILSVVGAVTGG